MPRLPLQRVEKTLYHQGVSHLPQGGQREQIRRTCPAPLHQGEGQPSHFFQVQASATVLEKHLGTLKHGPSRAELSSSHPSVQWRQGIFPPHLLLEPLWNVAKAKHLQKS